jgi:hypothetical protein
MSVLLTSFKKSKKIKKSIQDIEMFSVSRWQPKGYKYKVLNYLSAYDKYDKKLTLSYGINCYKNGFFKAVIKNRKKIQNWLTNLSNEDIIGLCCWCPHSKSSKSQIKKYKTFVCHTGLIGMMINKYRPDIELLLDKDRHQNLLVEWKPKKYKIIDI